MGGCPRMSGRSNVSKRYDVWRFACGLQLTVVFIPISLCFLLANLRLRLTRQVYAEYVKLYLPKIGSI